VSQFIEQFRRDLEECNPNQPEFQNAVIELVEAVEPLYKEDDTLAEKAVLKRLTEPDRVVSFRVTWVDDEGQYQVNRGWRVQFNQALGPYKGGLRFHPSVNESILKFLAFEQTFKNALTGLPLGGAKGGSNFDPSGRSEQEIMRFCQSFMTELYRYIGPDHDVPAGDIGVGEREIGFLFGHYLRLQNQWSGAMTGKQPSWGGSALRTEATGYGCIYFLRNVLEHRKEELEGKRILISGAGNVALHAAEKALELGAVVATLSDSDGTLCFGEKFDQDLLERLKTLKLKERGRLSELSDELEYLEGKKPWGQEGDIALPCATQNEIGEEDAQALAEADISVVCEGANMPVTPEGAKLFREAGVTRLPGKAANAGGVAVSGLEMSQDSLRLYWEPEKVDNRLQEIMRTIHQQCLNESDSKEQVDYVRCADRAAFKTVSTALLDFGAV